MDLSSGGATQKIPTIPRIRVNNFPSSGRPVVELKAGLWTGEGPPVETIPGAAVGDEYLDTITGDIYRLEPGD